MKRIRTILTLLVLLPPAMCLAVLMGMPPWEVLSGLHYEYLIDRDGWNPDEIARRGG